MAITFDRIVIAVPDLPEGVAQYRQLFGIPPVVCNTPWGEPAAWWGLPNTVIEMVQGAVARPQLRGIVFASPAAASGESPVANSMGLDIRAGDGCLTADFRRRRPAAQCARLAVDHVVLHTDNAQACIALFTDELGIRLALDKTVSAWGGRMLFFRAGKLTLEVMASDSAATSGNTFWGLAYQCQDLAAFIRDVGKRGVAVSAIREGRKPGTLVATLKSHYLNIPTLLIQPAK